MDLIREWARHSLLISLLITQTWSLNKSLNRRMSSKKVNHCHCSNSNGVRFKVLAKLIYIYGNSSWTYNVVREDNDASDVEEISFIKLKLQSLEDNKRRVNIKDWTWNSWEEWPLPLHTSGRMTPMQRFSPRRQIWWAPPNKQWPLSLRQRERWRPAKLPKRQTPPLLLKTQPTPPYREDNNYHYHWKLN